MKLVIFYFSGTGNTWWVLSQLKSELENFGYRIEMYSLENPELKNADFVKTKISDSEHVIIGFPVYGSDMPANMREFIKSLPEVSDNKAFSAFCTQASFSGDASVYFIKNIEKKGYKFKQAFQFKMTTNFHVAMFPFCFSKPAEGGKLENIKKKALSKIKFAASKIADDEIFLEGNRFYQLFLGGLQRRFFRNHEHKLPSKFSFIPQRCLKCKLCSKTCPVNSITIETNPISLKRDNRCILCFRCYNFCPALAINFGKAVKHPESYHRYQGPIDRVNMADIQN